MLLTINLLAVAATCVGGLFPMAKQLLSRRGMWRIFAFRSGILLGVTFIDILPAAVSLHPVLAGWGALGAFALFLCAQSLYMVDTCPEYLEECAVHLIGWAAMAALCVHSFIDGFNLSVSFSAGTAAGFAVGTALTLHKLVDGFTLTSLLQQAGCNSARILAGLCVVALATPLGSYCSHLGISRLEPAATSILLGFAGGSFVFIGATDILPRLHKSDDRSAVLFFGAGLAAMLALHGFGE